MFPDWRDDNPYLELLVDALEGEGWEVVFPPVPSGRPAPLLAGLRGAGGAEVVHLHWQHEYTLPAGGGTRSEPAAWKAALKSLRFLGEMGALRARGVPVVWTVHNVVNHERQAERVELAASAALARLASAIVVHGEGARPVVAAAYRLSPARAARIEVVRHGHFLDTYGSPAARGEARRALGVEADAFVYLHLGALRAYKKADLVARAFRAVPGADARLVVAGRPDDPGTAAALEAEAAADARIRLELRWIPPEEVRDWLAAADALVYAADTVLMSSVVMLGLGSGLPLVLPRSGCLPDYVPEEGAAWYEPGREGDLARALGEVRTRDRTAMAEADRRAAGSFTWEGAARRLADLYARLRGEPAPR